MNKRTRRLTYLLIFCTFTSFGQSTKLDSIDSFVQEQAKRFNIPGIAACVVKGNTIVWSKAYGYANIEQAVPMDVATLINIGSISKTITATAVMQLWEAGKLQLDTDVNSYMGFHIRNPNHPDIPITIRQLLTHTSSIKDGPAYKKGYACGDPKRSLQDWIYNYFSTNGTFYSATDNFYKEAPDSLLEYANLGFGLLGAIVEKVSAMPFHKYVAEYIFKPLEMSESGYFLSEVDTNKLAVNYLHLGPLQKGVSHTANFVLPYFNPYCSYSFWNYPDGLVRTSVIDIANFAVAYMNEGAFNGKNILKKETIDLMMSPQLSKEIDEDQTQGLCWFQSSGLHPSWYHGGSDPGISTRMYVNKEDDIAVIVFQNATRDNTFYIIRELYNHFK